MSRQVDENRSKNSDSVKLGVTRVELGQTRSKSFKAVRGSNKEEVKLTCTYLPPMNLNDWIVMMSVLDYKDKAKYQFYIRHLKYLLRDNLVELSKLDVCIANYFQKKGPEPITIIEVLEHIKNGDIGFRRSKISPALISPAISPAVCGSFTCVFSADFSGDFTCVFRQFLAVSGSFRRWFHSESVKATTESVKATTSSESASDSFLFFPVVCRRRGGSSEAGACASEAGVFLQMPQSKCPSSPWLIHSSAPSDKCHRALVTLSMLESHQALIGYVLCGALDYMENENNMASKKRKGIPTNTAEMRLKGIKVESELKKTKRCGIHLPSANPICPLFAGGNTAPYPKTLP
ncbi:hypothetical protein LXL04_028363 [Taraxacum kok-saghyz]